MYCLKCGRETSGQVFCGGCLESMEQHPVKADTHVQLPNRKPPAPVKRISRRHRVLSPDELLVRLKNRNRGLWVAVILLLLCLCLTIALSIRNAARLYTPPVGRNYTITQQK